MRILYIDIETTPITMTGWTPYKAFALEILEHSKILGFGYAWNDGPVKTVYPRTEHRKSYGTEEERFILEELHRLLSMADVVIAHNGDKFDIKKINTRLIWAGFPPPEPFLTIDTLKIARKHFAFTKNNLGELGLFFGVGDKMHHSGYDLWKGCMEGDLASWREMVRYNKRDVELLRDIYMILRPWATNHPDLRDLAEEGCPTCRSKNLVKRGLRRMPSGTFYQRYQCGDCKAYSKGRQMLGKTG